MVKALTCISIFSTIAGLSLFVPQVQAQDISCGTDRKIDIAEMSWPSAAALAHIHAIILEKGFGCKVEIVSGDTVATSASMLTRGSPAIAPELWTSSVEEPWAKGVAAGKVAKLADAITDGTVEGWFVPGYTLKAHPEIHDIKKLIAQPGLFPDPEETGKGRLYSCPPGWACERSTAALFEALGMKQAGWTIFSPGSGGALDASIVRAFTRKEPILFYYWGPTAILGKYDAARVDLGPVDPQIYACNTDPKCTLPPRVTAYPSSPAIVAAAAWVKNDVPTLATYFSKVGLTNAQISTLLAYGDQNKADAKATAENFLETKGDVWRNWVPAAIAEKVKASLS